MEQLIDGQRHGDEECSVHIWEDSEGVAVFASDALLGGFHGQLAGYLQSCMRSSQTSKATETDQAADTTSVREEASKISSWRRNADSPNQRLTAGRSACHADNTSMGMQR